MGDEELISPKVLLDEIRLNRAGIKEVDDKLDGKVGRGELFGWLGTLSILAALLAAGVAVGASGL